MLMQVAFIGVLTAGLVSCAYNDDVLPLPAFGLGMTSDKPVPEADLFVSDPVAFVAAYVRDLTAGKSDAVLADYQHPETIGQFHTSGQMFDRFRETLGRAGIESDADFLAHRSSMSVMNQGHRAQVRVATQSGHIAILLERFNGRWGMVGITGAPSGRRNVSLHGPVPSGPYQAFSAFTEQR